MRWRNDPRPCENPNCRKMFIPRVHNQRVCQNTRCQNWKAKQNRMAYKKRKPKAYAAGHVTMPHWGEGCAVGSILFCPFPGVTGW